MNKVHTVVTICLAVAVIVLALVIGGMRGASSTPKFNTPFQAVLLDNGQVYYGKLSRVGTRYTEMTDVYYILRTEDPTTKQPKNVLVKRGKELHAPPETFFDASHIVMIEPVGTNSEVARLIQQSASQPQK